ncbi:MAG TPA: response regulator [Pyrinomonadaceae bacterium]|jgi:signal transduction histidine kinase/DNA-binding response OmpR family regulator|nr:response regulator [Pyrinomonadaceae bacterium]
MNEGEQQKINILLVDDNPSNLLSLEAILQAPDRNLVRAASGDEALRYLLNCDVAVILLDVYMPGINGFETAALIRGRERSRDIPIIFLTADSTGSTLVSKGYSLGAVDYIVKPVEPDILKSKVAVFVELFKKTEEIKRQAELLHEKNIELENANLQRLSMLIELGQQLTAERDPVQLLEKFCHAARHIVGAHYAAVGMLDADGRTLRHFLTSGFDAELTATAVVSGVSREILDVLLIERRPVRFSRTGMVAGELDFLPQGRPTDSSLVAPILSPTQLYGWLHLADKFEASEFSQADERLAATLTSQVAVAYENARLYEEAQHHAADLQQEVTERKQAEEERAKLLVREQAARAEAEAANRTKDEFLATLSHELRTPLTAVLGWSHLLRSGKLPEETAASALETIERNARAQSQLIDDLLDVSRIITGKLSLDTHPVALAPIIEAAINSVRPTAEAKNIQLKTELDHATGMVAGDGNRLQQVVWNLFSNAVKFTPDGGQVLVRLQRINSHAEIMVSDTGQGISAEFLPHVFDRFRQADGTTTRTHGGLGLGLAIVRHLVELHGGTVRADSPGAGKGAAFIVNLPLIDSGMGPGEVERAHKLNGDAEPPDRYSALDGLRVLVVDDEADTRDLIAAVLTRGGAEVQTAATASEALEALESWVPDVLVSDIGMPGEDGYAFIKKVRELDAKQPGWIPALALTAYANVEDRMHALSAGFQMHMSKPLDPGELLTVVASLGGRSVKI